MLPGIGRAKIWVIAGCAILVGLAILIGWQHIYAQGPPQPVEEPPPGAAQPGAPPPAPSPSPAPGAPSTGAPAASTAPSSPPEPTFGLQSVASGIKVMRIKNWDGTVTEMLRFKYRTMSGNVITVHLPAVYKSDKRTRAGWETLFMCYSMDYEAFLDQLERNKPPDVSAYLPKLMAEIRGEVPQGTFGQQVQGAAEASDIARNYLPGMRTDLTLPPLLPGMP